MKEIILGIDLGTTNSVASFIQADGKPKVIPNPEGTNTTPSVVAFNENGEVIVGNSAKRQMAMNPNTIASIKRKMGTTEKVEINGKSYTPEEISAKILSYIKDYSSKVLGREVKKAVITVPAYFNDAQRQATKNAGKIAGLEVVRIINEPTAAAICYGLESKKNEKILVFDLGGGTFDVSILEIGDGTFEVISTNGDNKLGGDDWDNVVAEHITSQIEKENKGVTLNAKSIKFRILEAAEKAKIALSSSLETDIFLPFIAQSSNGPVNFSSKLTRSKFEELTRHLLNRCNDPVNKALKDAKLTANQIDEVILVGGSTRMPAVQKLIKEVLNKSPNMSVNPDEAVSIGAAIQGGILSGDVKDVVLLDVTPLTLGIETLGGVLTPLINRNTTIPTTKSQIFSTAVDNQPAVDIVIYQGERPMAKDNKLLGHFQLTGIKPARRGEPKIEVTFSIDVNGIVNVKAKDLDTQKEQSIEIKNSSGLTKEEIDRMVKEAEENKAADEKRKEGVEIKNKAEQYLFMLERSLNENANKVSADQKAQVEKLRDEIKEAISKNDIETLKKRIGELEQASQMMANMQNAQNANGNSDNNVDTTASKEKDNVVDAEFTDKTNKN
ncbi:MAG: molecular chaperone DnaK [Bacilli bacterium]|nr:molecular chaperone DnaK [Bacilli bacterium]